MPEDFKVGEQVTVRIPDGDDRYDTNIFNAGWDDEMDRITEGDIADVIEVGDSRSDRPDYLLRFSGGERWWWDPNFMDYLEAKQEESVSDEDFDAVLN